ncbi:MAG: Flp pilus assembly complex ATPase component TadA, partial [Elusimicrobia bacterium]|nr:Flp pilus assembly complex ATPase component TadA [Elusimicrobiota bacterium]
MVVRNTSSLKKKLGDILVEVGIITPDQLKQAVEIQRTQGGKLGDILKQLNFCSEDVLLAFLGRQCGASYISLTEYGQIPSDVINLVPESVVRHQSLIPISREGNVLTIAMSDPLNIFATDDLKLLTGCEIKVVIASEKEIESAIETYYISGLAPAAPAQAPSAASFGESGTLPAGTSMQDIVKSLEPAAGSVDVQQVETEPETSNAYQLKLESEDAPVVKMVNLLLANAVKNRASDIHIECYESSFRVRYRLDGVLCNQPAPPKKYQNAIASRIKVMANLDVAERRLPQDGRMKIRVDGTEVNLRISTMPTVHGEKVVVRLLDAAKLKVDLTGLGFDTNSLDVYRKAIHSPQGIILITGPTGSGKSTTIYSTLSDLNCMDRNIITIE